MRRAQSSIRSALAPPAAITLASCGAVACSLVYSSDLNDARDSVLAQSSGGTEAGVGEAGSSSGTDGSGVGESGADGSSGEPLRGCSSYKPAPKFCKDFDTDTTVGSDWNAVSTEGGQVTLARTFWWSKPVAARIVQKTSPGCKYTRFEKSFPNVGNKRVSASFQLRPIGPWQSEGHTPFVFALVQQSAYCAALLYVNGAPDNKSISTTNVNVQYGDPQKNDVRDLVGAPRLDQWTDITISAVPTANTSAANLTFRFDYEDGSKDETTLTFPQCVVGGALEIYPGFHCDGGEGEMYFDDIRVDWE